MAKLVLELDCCEMNNGDEFANISREDFDAGTMYRGLIFKGHMIFLVFLLNSRISTTVYIPTSIE